MLSLSQWGMSKDKVIKWFGIACCVFVYICIQGLIGEKRLQVEKKEQERRSKEVVAIPLSRSSESVLAELERDRASGARLKEEMDRLSLEDKKPYPLPLTPVKEIEGY
jgi:hypothetical protein